MKDIEGDKMAFITMPPDVKGITCMKLSPNKKFLVVCEEHVSLPNCLISIFEVKGDSPKAIHAHLNLTALIDQKTATQVSTV